MNFRNILNFLNQLEYFWVQWNFSLKILTFVINLERNSTFTVPYIPVTEHHILLQLVTCSFIFLS